MKKNAIIKMIFNFIPLTIFSTWVYTFIKVVQNPSLKAIIALVLAIYIIPPLAYRLIRIQYPIILGISEINSKQPANGWMLAMRFQILYSIFPFIEKLLLIVPGAYNMWLRLWGSTIGKNVYWTPAVEIVDRTHLIIEDEVFVGNKTYLSSHIAKRKADSTQIFNRPIHLKKKSFVSTHCILGPGSELEENEILPPHTSRLYKKTYTPSYKEERHD